MGLCWERELGTIWAIQDEGQDSEKTWNYIIANVPFVTTLLNIKTELPSRRKNSVSEEVFGLEKGIK